MLRGGRGRVLLHVSCFLYSWSFGSWFSSEDFGGKVNKVCGRGARISLSDILRRRLTHFVAHLAFSVEIGKNHLKF